MKKSMLMVMAAGYVLITILAECNSPSKKVENATENLREAKQELNQAQMDSAADFELFKKESEAKIDNNEKLITAFRQRMATDKIKIKVIDQKVIDDLEQRNINMRKRMEEYKGKSKDEWNEFKIEFNRSMDDLGNAVKKLGFKNTK